jgi:hypothetical protein
MADTPKFAAKDIPFALSTLIQALVVQLMDSGALTVEEGQRVFDAAAKRVRRAKNPGDTVRLIEHLSEQMQWDKLFAADARRRRPKGSRDH